MRIARVDSPGSRHYRDGMPQNPRPLPPGPAPRTPPVLDPIDRALLLALVRDGRASNAALAREVGIAESTCLDRVRNLRRRGLVTGVHAQVDLARVGLAIHAMVALRLAGHDRDAVDAFGEHVSGLPGVLAAYNVTGADDFLVHVVAATPEALREFVLDHLSGYPGVVHMTTSLVFRAHPGRAPLPLP